MSETISAPQMNLFTEALAQEVGLRSTTTVNCKEEFPTVPTETMTIRYRSA